MCGLLGVEGAYGALKALLLCVIDSQDLISSGYHTFQCTVKELPSCVKGLQCALRKDVLVRLQFRCTGTQQLALDYQDV